MNLKSQISNVKFQISNLKCEISNLKSPFFSLPLCLCGVLLFLAACSKPPQAKKSAEGAYDPAKDPLVNPPSLVEPVPSDRSQVATDETLFIQLRGSPNTLNPILSSSQSDTIAYGVLYDTPFIFDKKMDWKVNESMVESFQESEDHTTITAKLRPNLKWHDGHPLTAHDIVFSWDAILDDAVPCPAVKTGTDQIVECVALDDLTVKFRQEKPLATRLWNVLFPIIPKHLYEKHRKEFPDLKTGEYYNQQARAPIGNGPYKFVEWREQDQIVVERWEEYPGPKPYFKRIVMKIIPDDHVALLAFEKGEVDVIEELTPQQFAIETVQSKTFGQIAYKGWAPEWTFRYIGWNMDGSNPFFKDKRVRLAMTHALNLPLILDKVFYKVYPPCHGIYHPDSWMYNPDVKLLGYDPKKSAALLDEAGWKVDPKDGWRYKDGVVFEFEMLMPMGRDFYPKIAAIFEEDLNKIGVRMKTRLMEWSAFMEKSQEHEFQAHMAGWGTGTDPDTNWNLWRTEEYKTGRNYGGYSNPEVDKLFELGRAEFDPAKRAKIYQQTHKLIYDDQPYTFLFNVATTAAFNQRIRGVQFSPRGIYTFDPSFYAWWVAKGKGKVAAATP